MLLYLLMLFAEPVFIRIPIVVIFNATDAVVMRNHTIARPDGPWP